MLLKIACVPQMMYWKCTQFWMKVFIAIIVNPRYYRYKICYKTWNVTFDQSWVSQNNVDLMGVRIVRLSNNWKNVHKITCFTNCLYNAPFVWTKSVYPNWRGNIQLDHCQSKIQQIQNLLQNLEFHTWPKLNCPK